MVKGSVITFYRSCNKPTFWFACVVLWQLMAFLPSMPSMVLYGVYIAYALYVLFHSSNLTFYKPLLVFLLYVPVQLMLVAPDSSFHCWDRFVLFVLLLICVSPLLNNLRLAKNRRTIFRIALYSMHLSWGRFFLRSVSGYQLWNVKNLRQYSPDRHIWRTDTPFYALRACCGGWMCLLLLDGVYPPHQDLLVSRGIVHNCSYVFGF